MGLDDCDYSNFAPVSNPCSCQQKFVIPAPQACCTPSATPAPCTPAPLVCGSPCIPAPQQSVGSVINVVQSKLDSLRGPRPLNAHVVQNKLSPLRNLAPITANVVQNKLSSLRNLAPITANVVQNKLRSLTNPHPNPHQNPDCESESVLNSIQDKLNSLRNSSCTPEDLNSQLLEFLIGVLQKLKTSNQCNKDRCDVCVRVPSAIADILAQLQCSLKCLNTRADPKKQIFLN